MIGIYEDAFIDFLKLHLGDQAVRITSANIIIRCPNCEMLEKKERYHLNIGINQPVFNCLRAGCNYQGSVAKLIKDLVGNDFDYPRYVNIEEMRKVQRIKKIDLAKAHLKLKKFNLPVINRKQFQNKIDYLKYRFHYAPINVYDIHGLIVNPIEFFSINNIALDERAKKRLYYLQDQYIGFLTENHGSIVFRNINPEEKEYRFYRHQLQNIPMLDYYKLSHETDSCLKSNAVVLAEGIFDIFDAHIFNYMNLTNSVLGFYCALSNKFERLLKSIAYFDNIYRPDVIILSDSNVKINYYRRIKKYIEHLCNKIIIYYNVSGGDFGDLMCTPEKIII